MRAIFRKFKDAFRSYRNNVAVKYYKKKLRNRERIAQIFEEFQKKNILKTHYGDMEVKDENIIFHLGIQLAELINAAKERIDRTSKKRFLDVGDSDGSVLSALGIDKGIGLNISRKCVTLIKMNGGLAVRGDLESLPFKDMCFDNAICFETLEHLKNPIKGIQELNRVAERAFLSIPWTKRTRINKKGSSHVFEFSPEDFEKILTYTDFKVKSYKEIKIFPKILNPLHSLIIHLFYSPSFFLKFQFYDLLK
jgi:SAM-dependent methyltransferase